LKPKALLFAVLCWLSFTWKGQAFIQHFPDKTEFLQATGATSSTGVLPDIGVATTPRVLGSIIVTLASGATQLQVGGTSQQTDRIEGAEISVVGKMNLNLMPDEPIYAFGFHFVEPEADPLGSGQTFVDSTFDITLKNGSTVVGRFQFNPPNDTNWFLGLSSTRQITNVELRETTGGNDWEFIGEIYTSTSPSTVTVPETGDMPAVFTDFDATIKAYLDDACYPGFTAAVTYDGRLLYRRSYGWTDYAHSTPLHYNSSMKLGSVSKPLTATLIKNLIRAGQLSGSQKMVDLLQLTPPEGMEWVSGFTDITVDHLLAHEAGVQGAKPDENTVGDLLNLGRPATFIEVLSWLGTQPLLFTPGTDKIYSNFGYGVLGATSEVITGQRYEKSVTEMIGNPLGAYTIRSPSDEPYTTPPPPGVVLATTYINNNAAGGMAASAPDYCRFMRAFRMTGVPKVSATPGGSFFYTFFGSVDGAVTMARQRQTGGHALEWVIFFNDRGYGNISVLNISSATPLLAISSFPSGDMHPYLNWKLGWFWDSSLGVLKPGAGDTEDSDNDGMPTLIEYGFGRFPNKVDGTPNVFNLGSSGRTVEFVRSPARVDVAYDVEISDDLVNWTKVAGSVGGATAESVNPDEWSVTETASGADQRVTVTDLSTAPRGRFYRLRLVPYAGD
jgi:CubicO group peptidase (beta-lactamase class C family)